MTREIKNFELEVTIDKIVPGGKGLARSEGKVIFVTEGLPGEKLKIKLTKSKKDFAEAEIIEILSPSRDRVKPKCEFYSKCGGCDFQHLSYDAQVSSKKSMIEDSLKRLGSLENIDVDMHPSPAWEYRQRARFAKFKENVGFKGRSSNEVISIDSCPILTSKLNQILEEDTIQNLPWVKPKKKFTPPSQKSYKAKRKIKPDLSMEYPVLSNGSSNLIGDGFIEMEVKDKVFRVENDVFFQSNALILGDLVGWVSEHAQAMTEGHIDAGEVAVDLFSGVGFFAAFLADEFKKVIAVERNKKCLDLAKVNCPSNVEFFAESAEKWVHSNQSLSIDFLVVDPPREGVDQEVIQMLHQWKPQKWVYVSCNPVTLARDIKRISEYGVYKVSEVKGFDFYPQTSHVEAAAVFEHID